MAEEPKVARYDIEGSSHSESKTPPLKRKMQIHILVKQKRDLSKMAKRDIRSASTSSLGATQMLEIMTQPLPFNVRSPLGSDLTNLLLTMKGKKTKMC